MRRVLAVALMVVVCGFGFAAEPLDPDSSAAPEDQVRELFSEAVRLYRSGRFDEAALRFNDALSLEPSNRLVFEFYRKAGDALVLRMAEKAELEDVMRDVLRKARIYHKQLRTDPRYLNLLITKLRGSEKERLAATYELVSIGPIAVPLLVDKLHETRQQDFKVWCRMVLSRMGSRAVVPLEEALKSDDPALVSSVATILGDIGDPRAMPKLVQMVNDSDHTQEVKNVCRNSIAAIAARSSMATIPEASALYFQEAMRYFRDGDHVRDEVVANESLMWRWVEDPAEGAMELQYTEAPYYAWNELMAEQLLFDGASHYADFAAYTPLLAAVLTAQKQEVELRLKLARERVHPPQLPAEAVAALEQRDEALAEILLNVRMIEPDMLYRAVSQSIVSERYDVAIKLMELLRDEQLADAEQTLPSREEGLMADKSGTVLVAALEHPEKRIRYQAAATLAHLDPAIRFFNSERVVPLLSEAVGEWGMITVLVLEEDFRHRNTARSELQNKGMLAFTANDGFQARAQLNEAPVKDAIIISGTLQPALRDEHGVVIDVKEQTPAGLVELFSNNPATAETPIFIAVPENKELAAKIKDAFEGKVAGFVQRPYNGTEMKGLIENALGDHTLPDLNRAQREQVSLNAAKALGAIDPVTSQFDISQAADALVGTIAERDDDIRIAALHALGLTGDASKIDRVTEVYESQAEVLVTKPEVRAAFLYAIGLLNPNTSAAVDIIADALVADQLTVREAASRAVGHGRGTEPETLWDYERLRRFDVRAPGAKAE